MKLIKGPSTNPHKTRVDAIPAGTAVINGEGNICMVCRSGDVGDEKIRMVNLENGGTYSVRGSCEYQIVEASVTWNYKGEQLCS